MIDIKHSHRTNQIEPCFLPDPFRTIFRTYPEKPIIPVVEQLQKAFGTRFEEAMTQLVLGTLPTAAVFADPLTPVTFFVDGIDYVWQPGVVPLKLHDGPR